MAHRSSYSVNIDGEALRNEVKNQAWRPWLFAALSLCETLLFSGLHYGWGPLLFVFKNEGIYADLCSMEKNMSGIISNSSAFDTCPEREKRFNLWFTIGASSGFLSNVIIGFINHQFGTTKTRIIFMFVYIAGTLCLAFTSVDLPWLILPGLSCLAVSGFSIVITNIRVARFLIFGSAVYHGLLNGCCDTSAVMTRVIKALDENGIQRKYSFGGITVIFTIIYGVNTVLHSRFTEQPEEDKPEAQTNIFKMSNSESESSSNSESESSTKAADDTSRQKQACQNGTSTKEKMSIKRHLTSSLYILHTVFISVLVLQFVFFLGSINAQLESFFTFKYEVDYFTNVLAYTMMGGIICAFITGLITEWQKNYFSDSTTELQRRLLPLLLPLSICGGLAILLSALIYIPSANIFYALYVNFVLLRSFVFSVHMIYIANVFPSEYTSLLYGIVMTVSALIGLLQYPLFIWMEEYDNALDHVNLLFLGVCVLSLVHPLNVYLQSRKKKK